MKPCSKRAIDRTWKQLVRDHLSHTKPSIPHGARFWPPVPAGGRAIADALPPSAMGSLAEQLGIATSDETVTVADAAYWVKGCSSLGRPRYAVLLAIKDAKGSARLAMLDIKDAPPAAAPAAMMQACRATMPSAWWPPRGPVTRPREPDARLRILDRPMVLRELAPEDLKDRPDHLPPLAMIRLPPTWGGCSANPMRGRCLG